MSKKRLDDDFFGNIDVSVDEEIEEKDKDGESILIEKMKKDREGRNNPKISKNQKRKPVAFSLHDDVREKLDEYCKEHSTNKSMLVEGMIKKFLRGEGIEI